MTDKSNTESAADTPEPAPAADRNAGPDEASTAIEDDPLYLVALAVEQDEELNAEMAEWRACT